MSATSEKRTTVGEYLLGRLSELGLRHMFGVPGDFVIRFCHQVEQSNIKWVGTCNELNAAYAADGYARINGIGAVTTTFSVGELSAVNGIAGSFAERVPVVHIVGSPRREQEKGRLPLHHSIQTNYRVARKVMKRITVANAFLDDPATAPQEIDRVLVHCLKEHGPVYICVPNDVFSEECQVQTSPLVIPAIHMDKSALLEAASEAIHMIEASNKPIVIADIGVAWTHARMQLLSFLEASGIPFVTTMTGKAIVSETHPQFFGVYQGRNSSKAVSDYVESSDCVIQIGVLDTDINTGFFTTFTDPSKRISVAANGHVAVSQHWFRHVPLPDFLSTLAAGVVERRTFAFSPAIASLPHSPMHGWSAEPKCFLKSGRVFDRLSHYLPENCIVVSDIGVAMFGIVDTVLPAGATFVAQSFYASIGYSVGAAFGAAVAAPERKVILIVGDGAFQMTAQEISSMIRLGLPVTIVLLNNNGYSIERLIHEGGFNDIQNWDYSQLPKALGGEAGVNAHTEGELDIALAEAAKRTSNGKMCLVEVKLEVMDVPEALTNAGKSMR